MLNFPPLKTVDTVPGNLPAPPTSFVGRDAQITELVALVGQRRLVTLTGVGGVGKTRLSIQVAAELTPRFADGVWFVELAPVADAAAVPDTVATALGVTPLAGMSVIDSLALALSGRRLLIVFDNCEHVIDAAARVVDAILAHTTTVSIITTSREPLGISGEHTWPVPPLDVDEGVTSPAVSLFVERATAATPDFSLDGPGTVEAVTEICQRLDGIALAIELAAARMVSMSAEEVRDRLGDRFRLLAGGRRGLERHQTLRQAVSWSYDLLTDDERSVLECCSVFADGFDLEAISVAYGSDDEFLMLDLVEGLVRKSLLLAKRHGGRTRYRALETIRQFGEERLVASGRDARGTGPACAVLLRADGAALGIVGWSESASRTRLGRHRIRQPAHGIQVGERAGGSRSSDHDRGACGDHDLAAPALRTGQLGARDSRLRRRGRGSATAAPVRRRQSLPLSRRTGPRRHVRTDRDGAPRRRALRPVRGGLERDARVPGAPVRWSDRAAGGDLHRPGGADRVRTGRRALRAHMGAPGRRPG